MKNKIRDEKGIVLVITMLLLVMMTVIGVMSINTTTTNISISGNKRLQKRNLHAGESGNEISGPVIQETVFEGAVPSAFGFINPSSDFVSEILAMVQDADDTLDGPLDNDLSTSTLEPPDMSFAVGPHTVNEDLDYLYATTAAGGAIEFASGYSGAGKGLGSAGAEVFYRMNIVSQGELNSTTRIGAIYKYITK